MEEEFCTEAACEEKALAVYTGTPWYPDGLQLSDTTQYSLAEMMQDVFGGYRKHEHVSISSRDKDVFERDGSIRAITYGELMPESFFEMMWKLGAKPGDRFYDLGAGTGKLSALAWLMGLRSTGIELSHDRWNAGCAALTSLEEVGAKPRSCSSGGRPECLPILGESLDYICGSLFDLDCSDADVIFLSSVMFSLDMVIRIAKTSRWLKPGCRIVSGHSFASHCYPEAFTEFAEIGDCRLVSSWKVDSRWYVQEVTRNPLDLRQRPVDLKRVEDFPPSLRRICQCGGNSL